MDATDETTAAPGARATPWTTQRSRQDRPGTGGGAVYGLGLIGAMAYFLQAAESGRDYALAIPKAIFWPTLLVYRLLKMLDL